MYLKRIKLRNFKSFAGAAEIPFQPGFTGVAGPNGMGKSNISDAILFVLGPTSSKALRAERLTHLFFNGGASKKAATDCEVSLVFDNADRLLALDTPEVEVTRYVKLAPSDPNGYYSYFYVNGKRTTQTEIDALLSHARLSGDGYNLVQQGDVNRIVSMGPIPRRGLVERLAGISQYDEQLQRADQKKADLDANLDRIRTLLGEIRTRLGQLDGQREQAIQYKQLQDQQRTAEAKLARAGHLFAREEVRTCEQGLTKLRDELEALTASQQRLQGQITELNGSIDAIDQEISRRGGSEAAKFQEELNGRRMSFARLDENVKHADDELATLSAAVQALSTQLKADERELEKLRASSAAKARAVAEVERTVAGAADQLRAATGDAEASQGRLASTRKELLQLQHTLEEQQRSWQAAVATKATARAELEASEQAQATAEDDARTRELELHDAEIHTKKSRGEAAAGGTAGLQQELFEVRAKEKTLGAHADELAQEVTELNRRYIALEARLKVRTEGGSGTGPRAAVDFLLSQRNLGRVTGIRGTVEELASIASEHETALQVAGGGRFQALVVETDQVAEQCVKLLRDEKRGRATFLPLNRMLPGRPKGKALLAAQSAGAVGFAIDLVKFDEELRPAFWYVFGETLVMKDLGHAREQMGGVRLVTLAGDLIEATGAITGGSLDTGPRGRGGENAVELKRLADELRSKSGQEADARKALLDLTERIRTLSEELARRSARAEASSSTQAILDQEVATAKQRLTEARHRLAEAKTAHAAAETALAAATKAEATASAELQTIKQSIGRSNDTYLGHLPGAVSTKIRSLQEAHEAALRAQVTTSGELEGVKASVQAAEASLAQRRTELAAQQDRVKAVQKELKTLRTSRDEAKEALEALRSVEAQQTQVVEGQLTKKRGLDRQRLALTEKNAQAAEAIRGRTAMVTQEEVHLATARQRLTEIESTLANLPPADSAEKPVPVDELRRAIQTLAAQLEAMGSVNLRALEEYDQEKARLDEFDAESTRLSAEKAELTGLVGEIETKKRQKLTEVVAAVHLGYKEIYADLSGGGEGAIALENPADPLAGGLLIQARPVGKTIQRLEQLSGGEKSLASLAFVFALQRHDPSPLYVFDEVDMSLDGINAENVGRMLRRNAERAQFIVISLRKVTLKFAHRLFGVTMHGDGCSRVVSLKLDEIVDVDEHASRESVAPVLVAAGGGA